MKFYISNFDLIIWGKNKVGNYYDRYWFMFKNVIYIININFDKKNTDGYIYDPELLSCIILNDSFIRGASVFQIIIFGWI